MENLQPVSQQEVTQTSKEGISEVEKKLLAAGRETKTKLQKKTNTLPTSEFIKIDKSLIEIGFFTPSAKKIRGAKEKIVSVKVTINGKKIPVLVHIYPSAKYGLPTTADQDKYLAFQQIVTDIKRREEQPKNPIAFTSPELLGILELSKESGKNYDEVDEWLDRMQYTGLSHVYLAEKGWIKDRNPNSPQNKIFERTISAGQQLDDGTIADKHLVWLSEWQLENLLKNHLLPIEFETYKKLKYPIAKALVPLLQIWLYATRKVGCFEILYENFCQTLCLHRYKYYSDILRKLEPAFNELKDYGYISDWKIEETSDGKGYKIIFYHGDKFHSDRRKRLAQREKREHPESQTSTTGQSQTDKIGEAPTLPTSSQPAPASDLDTSSSSDIDLALLIELTKRGIYDNDKPTGARGLIKNKAPEQYIMDQLEYGDFLISQAVPGKFTNPPGFYIHLIRQNVIPIDPRFESSRQKRLKEEATQVQRQKEAESARLQLAYEAYCKQTLDAYISKHYPAEQYQALISAKTEEIYKQHKKMLNNWPSKESVDKFLAAQSEAQVNSEIAKEITFMPFEQFCNQKTHIREAVTAQVQTFIVNHPPTKNQGRGQGRVHTPQNPP